MIEEIFKNTLKRHKLYVTRERLGIFQVLKDNKLPCSLNEIVDRTENFIDRSTVYRTLDKFEEIGITHRIYNGWKYNIELSDDFSPHHHHMTCTNCGSTTPFEETNSFTNELNKIEKTNGFKSESHSLELRGLCKNCC